MPRLKNFGHQRASLVKTGEKDKSPARSPEEDIKTIDIDVKTDKLFLYSHQYKCRAFWSQSVKPNDVSSTWDPDNFVLSVRAPIIGQSNELMF